MGDTFIDNDTLAYLVHRHNSYHLDELHTTLYDFYCFTEVNNVLLQHYKSVISSKPVRHTTAKTGGKKTMRQKEVCYLIYWRL